MGCRRALRRGKQQAVCTEDSLDLQKLVDLKVVRLIDSLKHDCQRGPVMLEFSLTNACNLSCGFCWKRRIQDNDAFGTRRALRLVREAAEFGVKWVRVTGGGEPFLNPKAALAVMREVKRHGMFGTLVTNATTFNRPSIRKIVAMGWDEILVSLDGATPKTHDSLRGKRGTFDTVVAALQLFAEEKENQASRFPVMKLQCVVTRQNYHELLAYVNLASKLDVRAIDLLPLMDFSPLGSHYQLDASQRENLINLLGETREHAWEASILLRADPQLYADTSKDKTSGLPPGGMPDPEIPVNGQEMDAGRGKLLCYEPFLSITIQANGSVAPCCCWYGSDFQSLGKDGLASAWYSERFKVLRQQFKANKLHENCRRCHAYRQELANDLGNRLAGLWDNPQHMHRYRSRVAIHDPLPALHGGSVTTMDLSGKLIGLATRPVKFFLLGLDMFWTLMGWMTRSAHSLLFALDDFFSGLLKRTARSVESFLLSLEDRLRQKVAHYQLPPFVLRKEEAHSVLQAEDSRIILATFEENCYPDCYLAGNFPEGAVTTEQLGIIHAPTPGRGCRRVRFRLLGGNEHGEVFVTVGEEIREWRSCKKLNLWYRGRSEATQLSLTFTDAMGQRWFSHHRGVLTGGRWQLLRVPLSNFHCPKGFQKDNIKHLENVAEMTVHISCSPEDEMCRGWVDLYEVFLSK